MNKSVVNICDVCTEIFAGGDAPKKNISYSFSDKYNIPIYSNGELNDGLYGYTDTPRVIVPSVTISARGTIGFVKIRKEPFLPIVRLISITPKTDLINIGYLYYALKNYRFNFNGTSIPQLTVPMLKKYSFPLPSIEQQKKIVDVLDKVENLIDNRHQQLNLLDELIKSRFIEMFGDPVTNNKGFPTRKGEDFFKLSNGKTVPFEKRKDYGVPAYGGNGISWYTEDVLCEFDTIVVGRVGFQSGNVHFVKAPLWVTDNAMYISWFDSDLYNLIFLTSLMECVDFAKFQDMGDLKKVTQQPFMQFQYICPSIEMQKKYIIFLNQTDKSKLIIKKSLDELNLLKDSLMQKYFG